MKNFKILNYNSFPHFEQNLELCVFEFLQFLQNTITCGFLLPVCLNLPPLTKIDNITIKIPIIINGTPIINPITVKDSTMPENKIINPTKNMIAAEKFLIIFIIIPKGFISRVI